MLRVMTIDRLEEGKENKKGRNGKARSTGKAAKAHAPEREKACRWSRWPDLRGHVPGNGAARRAGRPGFDLIKLVTFSVLSLPRATCWGPLRWVSGSPGSHGTRTWRVAIAPDA
jgi:hypothetical protein